MSNPSVQTTLSTPQRRITKTVLSVALFELWSQDCYPHYIRLTFQRNRLHKSVEEWSEVWKVIRPRAISSTGASRTYTKKRDERGVRQPSQPYRSSREAGEPPLDRSSLGAWPFLALRRTVAMKRQPNRVWITILTPQLTRAVLLISTSCQNLATVDHGI